MKPITMGTGFEPVSLESSTSGKTIMPIVIVVSVSYEPY
jgi:hypothetical protein